MEGVKVGSEQRKIRRLLNHPSVLRVPLKPAPSLAVRRTCSTARYFSHTAQASWSNSEKADGSCFFICKMQV